jgi:hypothetical protein
MGLAPYGTPKYEKIIRDNLIDLKPDGSFRLNLDYFNYCTGLTMTNRRFEALFGGPPRNQHGLSGSTWTLPHQSKRSWKMRSCASPAASRTRPEWTTFVSQAASRSTASPTGRCSWTVSGLLTARL